MTSHPARLTIVIINMLKLRIPHPIIMVIFRPILSSARAGSVLPTGNIRMTNPAINCARWAVMPTLTTSTVGM